MLLGAERARRGRRHRLDLREQHVGGPAEPRRSELDAFERRTKFAVVQVLSVARRAALFVDGVPGALLRRRERGRGQRLRGDRAGRCRPRTPPAAATAPATIRTWMRCVGCFLRRFETDVRPTAHYNDYLPSSYRRRYTQRFGLERDRHDEIVGISH